MWKEKLLQLKKKQRELSSFDPKVDTAVSRAKQSKTKLLVRINLTGGCFNTDKGTTNLHSTGGSNSVAYIGAKNFVVMSALHFSVSWQVGKNSAIFIPSVAGKLQWFVCIIWCTYTICSQSDEISKWLLENNITERIAKINDFTTKCDW